jgi:small subunit ribosomal protein S6
MTAYEILLMLDTELPEERQSEIVTRTRELIEQGGGTWRSHDPWGRRRLAYEIDHKAEGVYHLVVFDAEAETLAEVTRVLKITDGVVRHLAVKHVEGSQTRAPRDEVPVPQREESERAPEYAAATAVAEAEPEAAAEAAPEPQAGAEVEAVQEEE